ncbi:hypothetical protein DVU_2690 [Nitratidesulfovibrio vulgaris str. Hildenborough]|uniref:Uncharacterized protein n=2 Tax=Nitratidesulfovibrio vulgaris TaxID=881 RepID=Q728B4_NITV2|nr:hypothetical protein DVU_2690 [Nitratidesulfovibrio vulgaris str. Hildenborough]ADP87627.1 hypothetical protein Deval_2484 [Nitratidesulfovibrio vulgaris RCH1]
MAWYGNAILTLLADCSRTKQELADALGIKPPAVCDACKRLRANGYVQWHNGYWNITDKGWQMLASGQPLKSGPGKGNSPARGRSTLRAKAWRAMRMLEGFSLDDLLTMLCDGSEGDPSRNLTDYLRALVAAGYLMPLPRRGNGRHPQRYRLRRDRYTGPDAPAWNKPERTLTDPNTGEVFRIPRKRDSVEEAPHA